MPRPHERTERGHFKSRVLERNRQAQLANELGAPDQLGIFIRTKEPRAEFAAFLVRTTIEMQRFIVGLHGVGVAINLATITPAGGVRRDAVPGVASAPGVHEIGDMFDAKTETTADDGGLTRYTVASR